MDYTCINCMQQDTDFPGSRHDILPNRAISLAATRGTLIHGECGTLWLTQEGHSRDYILIAGADYRSTDNGRIVVSAVGGGGAITVSRLKPDERAVARTQREAWETARMTGHGIARILARVREALRPLTIRHGGPILRDK